MILDNLIAEGKAKPMILVSPPTDGSPELIGNIRSTITIAGTTERNNALFARTLLEEVLPQMERMYRASRDRSDRAIAGMSMGGAEALYVGLNHLDRFAWVASLSGAMNMLSTDAQRAVTTATPRTASVWFDNVFPGVGSEVNGRLHLFWIACGTSDDGLSANRQFKDWLKSKGVQFADIETQGRTTFPSGDGTSLSWLAAISRASETSHFRPLKAPVPQGESFIRA